MLFGKKEDRTIPPAANDDIVFDAGTQDFEDRVMRASMDLPVLVDFWAPWCGPCKQLTPVIEEAVRAAGGKVKLAKVNIDEHPELAQALRIQSVPMVFGFIQGQPVNAFVGVKSKTEISSFIDQLVKMAKSAQPDAIDVPKALAEAAAALANGDLNIAQGVYVQILTQDELNVQAYTGLIRTFIAGGQLEHAQEMIGEAPPEIAKDPAFEAARTALDLAANAPSGGELAKLTEKLKQNPADHQTRFDLAEGLFASGNKEQAIDELIEIIRRNRAWEDEKARKQLLKFFDALGPADPLTAAGRRKLSTVLFS